MPATGSPRSRRTAPRRTWATASLGARVTAVTKDFSAAARSPAFQWSTPSSTWPRALRGSTARARARLSRAASVSPAAMARRARPEVGGGELRIDAEGRLVGRAGLVGLPLGAAGGRRGRSAPRRPWGSAPPPGRAPRPPCRAAGPRGPCGPAPPAAPPGPGPSPAPCGRGRPPAPLAGELAGAGAGDEEARVVGVLGERRLGEVWLASRARPLPARARTRSSATAGLAAALAWIGSRAAPPGPDRRARRW